MFPTKKTKSEVVTPQAVSKIDASVKDIDNLEVNFELDQEKVNKLIKALLFKVNKQQKEIELLKANLVNKDKEIELLKIQLQLSIKEVEPQKKEHSEQKAEIVITPNLIIEEAKNNNPSLSWEEVKEILIKDTPQDLIKNMSLELSCNILGINRSWCYTDLDIEKFYQSAYFKTIDQAIDFSQKNLMLKNFKNQDILTTAYLYLLNWNFIPY
jgi:hypothetical protein